MWLDWSSIWPTGGISVSISDRCYGDLLFCHPVIPLHQLSSCCHFHHVQEHIIFRLEPFSPCEELRRTQWSLYVDASYLCHVYFTGVAAGQRLTGFKLNCMSKPQNIYLVMSQPASDTEKWIKSSVLTFRSQHKWEERCPVFPTGASKERFCLHLLRCEDPSVTSTPSTCFRATASKSACLHLAVQGLEQRTRHRKPFSASHVLYCSRVRSLNERACAGSPPTQILWVTMCAAGGN